MVILRDRSYLLAPFTDMEIETRKQMEAWRVEVILRLRYSVFLERFYKVKTQLKIENNGGGRLGETGEGGKHQ